jgi:hypothetical protein
MRYGAVGGQSHLSAKGVDFARHVALGRTADAAVAGQMADPVESHRDAQRPKPQSRTGEGRFDAGMTGPYHDNVERFGQA